MEQIASSVCNDALNKTELRELFSLLTAAKNLHQILPHLYVFWEGQYIRRPTGRR